MMWVMMLSYQCCTLIGTFEYRRYVMELHQTEEVYSHFEVCRDAGEAWKATFPTDEHWRLHYICIPGAVAAPR